MCDSVLHAVKQESKEMLTDLCPGFQDLKAVFDTSDIEMMKYQIGLKQKELQYRSGQDMKRLTKFARSHHVTLRKLEKTEYIYKIEKTADGYRYANVRIKCLYRSRPYILYFVLIELNSSWYYGEGLRLEKQEVIEEVIPDYDKIDRELERKHLAREKARLKVIEDQKKQEENAKKEKEKEEKEQAKLEELKIKEAEKAKKEQLKEEEAKRRELEREKKRLAREEAKKKREKEIAEARKKREDEKKAKEEERKKKEK